MENTIAVPEIVQPASFAARPAADDFSSVLADFARSLSVDGLPASVIQAAKDNLFDTLICAVAGSSAAAVAEVRSLVLEWGGAPQASLFVFGDKLPAHHAAWVNGTMSHARDYDDTHDAAVLHAGVSVVPAAIAAAQLRGDVSGAELLAGIVVGLETVSRLGVATRIGIVESGFMYTPLLGHFAATAAAACIMGLDHAGFVNALGIAYSQVAGNHQVTRDAALTKRMQPGFAAMAALVSVQLAQKGIRGTQATFEGADGFFRVYLRGRYDPAVLRDGLGEHFEFTQLSYKPYPCCRFNHCGIEAALVLRDGLRGRIHEIRRIHVGLNRQAYQAVCTPIEMRRSPQTIVQAQFSIPYTVAAALLDGRVCLSHFTDELKDRRDIADLAQKVEPYIDEEIEKAFGRNVSPVLMTIELEDGEKMSHRIEVPLGHPRRPMSDGDFESKARDCFGVSALPPAAGTHAALRNTINRIESQTGIQPLLNLLS